MRNLGPRLVLGAALSLSGCVAGMVGPTDSSGELRLLTETVTSSPRVVLAAGSQGDSGEQPSKCPVIAVTVTESNEPPPDDAPPSNEPPPNEPPPYEPPTFDEPPRFDEEPSLDDLPAFVEESPFSDAPPAGEPSFDGAVASDQPDANEQQPQPYTPREAIQDAVIEFARRGPVIAEDSEEITTPGPILRSPFKPGVDERNQDRVSRQVTDVPLDIRPTEGEMPDDLAAARFGEEPTIVETWPSEEPADIFCSYTPWTICYRPLYFEDIKLERYGANVGYLQTGLSGARFFSTIAALPYKMTVRPPRSCQCSNGFSRPGDCPLPGYGHREFRWDASLVEAAAVAAVVYILP